MLTISGSRVVSLGLALGLSVILITPMIGRAEDQSVDLAPSIPRWDESSGYGSVETSRAIVAVGADPAPTVSIAVLAAQRALETSDPGSMVEDALLRIVAGSGTWDESSGYGSVELSRAQR